MTPDLTREAKIELAVEAARQRALNAGAPPSVAALVGDNCRFLWALEEIAAFDCRRLALRDNRQGWDCQQLGAPLCESCIAAEALAAGSAAGQPEK